MASQDIEKIIKRVQSDSDKRMKKYLGILHEQTEDRFKAIKEGMDLMNEKLDSHTEMIAELKEEVTGIKDVLGNHERRITKLEIR